MSRSVLSSAITTSAYLTAKSCGQFICDFRSANSAPPFQLRGRLLLQAGLVGDPRINFRLARKRVVGQGQFGFLQAFNLIAQSRRRLKFQIGGGFAHFRLQPFNMSAQIAAQQRRLFYVHCLAHAIRAGRLYYRARRCLRARQQRFSSPFPA